MLTNQHQRAFVPWPDWVAVSPGGTHGAVLAVHIKSWPALLGQDVLPTGLKVSQLELGHHGKLVLGGLALLNQQLFCDAG